MKPNCPTTEQRKRDANQTVGGAGEIGGNIVERSPIGIQSCSCRKKEADFVRLTGWRTPVRSYQAECRIASKSADSISFSFVLRRDGGMLATIVAVSYTHLTLPTIYSV